MVVLNEALKGNYSFFILLVNLLQVWLIWRYRGKR